MIFEKHIQNIYKEKSFHVITAGPKFCQMSELMICRSYLKGKCKGICTKKYQFDNTSTTKFYSILPTIQLVQEICNMIPPILHPPTNILHLLDALHLFLKNKNIVKFTPKKSINFVIPSRPSFAVSCLRYSWCRRFAI